MSDSKYRSVPFQFHLSTAVMMMFVAAALLWLNLASGVKKVQVGGAPDEWYIHKRYGWPFRVVEIGWDNESGFDLLSFMLNLTIALGLLAAFWFACELHIRRRNKKL